MPIIISAPSAVVFTDKSTSSSGITYWQWDFGDGDTSKEQNPTHNYSTPGIYTVTLHVASAKGIDTVTDTVIVMPAGIAHYWTLDETGGDRADSIGGKTLLQVGGAIASASGISGNAASFDGTIDLSLSATPFAFTTYTINGWYRKSGPRQNASIVSTWDGDLSNGSIWVVHGGTEELKVVIIDAVGTKIATAPGVAAEYGVWRMFTVRVDGALGTVRVQRDAGTPGTVAIVGPLDPPANNFTVGNWPPGSITGREWLGEIDEISIYNRCLTDDEVTALYAMFS